MLQQFASVYSIWWFCVNAFQNKSKEKKSETNRETVSRPKYQSEAKYTQPHRQRLVRVQQWQRKSAWNAFFQQLGQIKH